jgi:hypothetical protein
LPPRIRQRIKWQRLLHENIQRTNRIPHIVNAGFVQRSEDLANVESHGHPVSIRIMQDEPENSSAEIHGNGSNMAARYTAASSPPQAFTTGKTFSQMQCFNMTSAVIEWNGQRCRMWQYKT